MIFSSIALRNASPRVVVGLRRFPPTACTKNSTTPLQLQNNIRNKSSASGGIPTPLLHQWYNIFGKSTIGYATWLVAGILVCEGLTGVIGDGVWNTVNAGRTFDTVDWSKFATDDDEDDDEEEDEEEEEEDDEEEDEEDEEEGEDDEEEEEDDEEEEGDDEEDDAEDNAPL